MIRLLNTFRGKLLLILAALLILTLGVQLYINYLQEQQNAETRELQEKALVAGITLGFNGMQSEDRMQDFVSREGEQFFSTEKAEIIQDIIIINSQWEVYDSLSDKYLPDTDENNDPINKKLSELTDLPPLSDADSLGEDKDRFPNAGLPMSASTEGEAHAVPIETNQGRWYVMVLLKKSRAEAINRIVQPLFYTLAILLASTMITVGLVWRFTRPISNLSKAARMVAGGNLKVRLRDAGRSDEIGELATQFNMMTAELEKSRELEAQLQKAEKSAVVGRLASAIAHEIRNPLNYINLTLDHLRAKFRPNDDGDAGDFEKLTSQLKSEVERINRQISEFLHYSRPVKLKAAPTDVMSVVRDSIRLIEPQAEERGIEIEINAEPPLPLITADSELLRSVFSNLLINGAQAMKRTGGTLNVNLETMGDFVRIEISDTGVGISEENIDKIYEPYFSTKETGTGLGLAIVKKIVDDHKGFIEVESQEGSGTKFTVSLPVAKVAAPTAV